MKTKLLKSIKAITMFSFALCSIIACEKDFENVGVGLVDNDQFKTNFKNFNVVSNTKNVEFSRVDGLSVRNLGILKDENNNFGTLKASLISQLSIPNVTNFGLNPVIDTVILDIPYFATKASKTDNENGIEYSLDSVFGNQETKYKLKVSRLTTFLNTLNPSNPTQRKEYYSNEDYQVSDVLFYGDFNPNKNDTVLTVKRHLIKEKDENGDEKIVVEKIRKKNNQPSIKLPLNEALINQLFVDSEVSSYYSSAETFINYFRGIRIDAEEISGGGSIMTLATSGASINIYYTYEVLTDETDKDLNGDNDTDDKQVPVKTKGISKLSFSGITSSVYSRDYSGSNALNSFNSNSQDGQSEVFVQGSAGSNVEIDLFAGVDTDSLNKIRNENWLINGAVLDIYIKDSTDVGVPSRLYLYKDNNVIIKDVVTEAGSLTKGIGGFLRRDANNKPEKYTFYLTDYISDIFAKESTEEPSKLILKTYHSSDAVNIPRSGIVTDTIVDNYSWNVKGVVLKGNNISNSDAEKLALKIYYTENSKK